MGALNRVLTDKVFLLEFAGGEMRGEGYAVSIHTNNVAHQRTICNTNQHNFL